MLKKEEIICIDETGEGKLPRAIMNSLTSKKFKCKCKNNSIILIPLKT